MKSNPLTVRLWVLAILSITVFYACTKTHEANNIIQEGQTTIEINAIYPALQIRYNDVIDAPINVTIAFHLTDGQEKHVAITIPADYKQLQRWDSDGFLNNWSYIENGYDSTTNTTPPKPQIDPNWQVESVEIISVTCPDKQYGFKVLTGSDEWSFYHPTDSLTSVSFVANKDTVSYSDYDFNVGGGIIYQQNISSYEFYLFDYAFQMLSDHGQAYPLTSGMTMGMPFLLYRWNSRNYGSELDDGDPASNGSTLKLTVTKLTDTHFDATFSGKLWSSRQPDTLFIVNGEIKNALLPIKD